MGVRLDKWLDVACIFKTRTKATQACDLGRVRVNGARAKPHRNLAVGDRIEVTQGDWGRVFVVMELHDKSISRIEARRLYEDLSPPRPAADPIARIFRKAPSVREKGAGRPTKKERREMDRYRRR